MYSLIAYLATVIANAVRITTAIQMHRPDVERGWFDPGQVHRFEGILIYFGFLLLLFFFGEWIDRALDRTRSRNHQVRQMLQSGNSTRQPLTLYRAAYYLLPLTVYYAMTLAVPLANGAYRQGAAFWEHALFVLVTPLLLLLPVGLYPGNRGTFPF